MGAKSKRIGKAGEKGLKELIVAKGWLLADKETQGLAGDDLFARDPSGTWHSIEVKKVAIPGSRFIEQARTQALEREYKVKEAIKTPNSIPAILGMTFDASNWMLCWQPNGWGRWFAGYWIVFTRNGIEVWKES